MPGPVFPVRSTKLPVTGRHVDGVSRKYDVLDDALARISVVITLAANTRRTSPGSLRPSRRFDQVGNERVPC
jgi:hypothetical protein